MVGSASEGIPARDPLNPLHVACDVRGEATRLAMRAVASLLARPERTAIIYDQVSDELDSIVSRAVNACAGNSDVLTAAIVWMAIPQDEMMG